MTKDEALKMAIEALNDSLTRFSTFNEMQHDAIQACKDALEQPTLTYEDGFAHGYEAHRAEQALEQPAQEPVALLEALSDLEHQQWMKWAQSIMDSEPISDARKQRWATMMVDYKDLPDNIQEYDREWARKVLAITHPAPAWQGNKEFVGLSDDEIDKLYADWERGQTEYLNYTRAIEQALKEKNNA